MKKKIYVNAPLVLGFVAICILVFILQIMTKGASTLYVFSTYGSSWLDPFTYVRLLGHIFAHADKEHLIANMMYLLLLGPILEEKYGTKRLAFIILMVALTTGILHNLLQPKVVLLGSSGVCFAFILLVSVTGKNEGIPLTLLLTAILWLGQEIYLGFTAQDNISHFTHILGGLAGAGMGLYYKRQKEKPYHL